MNAIPHRPSDYVYRVTVKRADPEYWQNYTQTRTVTYRSLLGILKADRTGNVTVQRALIGEWEDFELQYE